MRAFLVLSIAILAATPSATEFERVVGGAELDRGVFVSPTQDGGYVVAGVTRSSGAGDDDVYLVKSDSTGTPIWTKTYGGPEVDNGWCVREIDGGFAIAGYTKSFGAGGFDFYLLVTDSDGELEWSKTYGGETDDRCWGLLQTADGGFLLVGETIVAGTEAADILVIKTDAAGEEEWSQTYGGEASDRCFSAVPAEDGGFVLVGQTYSEGAGDRDAYVIKTDPDGKMEWSRTFGGSASDVGHGVAKTADGNYLIVGYTRSFAMSGDDPYLIALDAEGDSLWTRVLHLDGTSRTITGEQAVDGGFYLVGFRSHPATGTAALLIRTDRGGHLEWSKEFLHTTEGQSFGYTVRATADGGCVFTGHTTKGSAGDLDLFITKVGAGLR